MSTLRERLAESRLYVCTDARRDSDDLEDFVRRIIAGGVDLVQVRDKTLTALDELRILESISQVCADEGALFVVNDRADLAQAVQADGLHIGQDDLPLEIARRLVGSAPLIGRSTHSPEQAAIAEADPDVDYFCVGPLWETPTKPGRPAAGFETLSAVIATSPTTPWFAIGGIDEGNLGQVVDAGSERIVVVRAITQADDPEAAARRLRTRLPG